MIYLRLHNLPNENKGYSQDAVPYNPLVLEEPVGGSLIDDIQDIYREIKKGIMFFQTNPAAALWEWKFGFDNHWGNHAVDAIRALHYMIRR